MIDTHCHLDFPQFDADRDTVIRRCLDNGIEQIVNIGSSLEGSERSVEIAQKYECIYAAVGVHPHEADSFTDETLQRIKELTAQKKVVALGEIGLDYYKNFSAPENQLRIFSLLVQTQPQSVEQGNVFGVQFEAFAKNRFSLRIFFLLVQIRPLLQIG